MVRETSRAMELARQHVARMRKRGLDPSGTNGQIMEDVVYDVYLFGGSIQQLYDRVVRAVRTIDSPKARKSQTISEI